MERSHEVEQDLLVLERDYGSMKANYATLLDKRLHARVAENMAKTEEKWKVPHTGARQFSTSTCHTEQAESLGVGFVVRLCFGVGLSVMRERLTPQFRGPEDVELLIGPQLLVAIPDFSFLWSQTKGEQYFPSAYHQRRSL